MLWEIVTWGLESKDVMENRDASVSSEAEGSRPPLAPTDVYPDNGHAKPGTDSEPPPVDAARAGRTQRSRSKRSHRHHGSTSDGSSGGGSRRDKQRRQTLIARLFAIAAVVVCVVLSMLLIRARSQLASHNMQAGALASELNRTRSELTQTKQLVAAQEVELGALLKQRIPGANPVEIEKLNDINNKYAKKLMFSESGTGAAKHLTYNLVLKNTGDLPITPAVTILLFDRKGLQTGVARVTHAAATVRTSDERLQPGETRTYSAVIERIRDDAHAYYLVEVK